jgi:chromosome segregation ATPase
MRAQLASKNEELLEAAAKRQQLDEALNDTRLERQALHGEVRLLHQQVAQLQACIEDDKRRLEVAERLQTEITQRAQDAERRMHDSDSRRREAEALCATSQRQAREAEYAREEAESKAQTANARAEDAEKKEAELAQKLINCENEWRLHVDAKTRDLELRCTELDLQRQAEIRAGLLELHALAQGQHALRTQILRTQSPEALSFAASSGNKGSAKSRLQTGQQPWEVWEMSSAHLRDNTYNLVGTGASVDSINRSSLLTGKVKEQAEFLDKQVRELESRQWSTIDASTILPGW